MIQYYNIIIIYTQNSADRAETIVYADIGPSSFTNRPQISVGLDDDDHVEYAQLNQDLLAVQLQPAADQTMDASSIGKRHCQGF